MADLYLSNQIMTNIEQMYPMCYMRSMRWKKYMQLVSKGIL